MTNSNSNSNSNFNSSEFYQLNTSSNNDNNTSPNTNSNSPELHSSTMQSIQVDIDMNNATDNNLTSSNNTESNLNLIDELNFELNNRDGGIDNNSNFGDDRGDSSQFNLINNNRDYCGEEEDDIYNDMGLRFKSGLIGEVKGYEIDITSECKLRVSSYKYGYPPSEMIDNNLETYWQSEGQLPHTIILKYSRQILLSKIKIYFDFPMDESYTPNLFTIGLTNKFNDYKELTKVQGETTPKWIEINCKSFNNNKPIPTFNIKLKILNNMEDGRDSHIRQIRIFELKDLDEDDNNLEFYNFEKLNNKGGSDKGNNIEIFNLGGFSGLEKIRI